MSTDDQLTQELTELTQLLHGDPAWKDLREAIAGTGLPLAGLLLAGFCEDEVGNEFGVVVTNGGLVFEFQRSSAEGTRAFIRWEQAGNVPAVVRDWPAVACALKKAQG